MASSINCIRKYVTSDYKLQIWFKFTYWSLSNASAAGCCQTRLTGGPDPGAPYAPPHPQYHCGKESCAATGRGDSYPNKLSAITILNKTVPVLSQAEHGLALGDVQAAAEAA